MNRLSSYSNKRFKQLDDKINRAEKRLNAGVAGVTAIASIPYVAENSFSYGVGIGNYKNGKAVATGIQYKTSLNTNVRLNVSWDSAHNNVYGAGFSGGW
ncbi:YadA-like family protein [Salmonella enterica subsp. enterica serovar Newport]|nr:YadA-like family protein [Salmonella enterica subsp. enterica serovar Newport]